MQRPFLLLLCLFALFVSACKNKKPGNGEISYIHSIDASRREKDKTVIEKGIIEAKDIPNFKGLAYFDPDTNYRKLARIKMLPPLEIVFKTNTERSPVYYTFCILEFKIGDSLCQLIAYASDKQAKEGLFIPFKDASNAFETYGGGRYVEAPYNGEKDHYVLDFNTAFNPYCHYNHTYSCPLVPFENHLKVAIKAGEKKFHE